MKADVVVTIELARHPDSGPSRVGGHGHGHSNCPGEWYGDATSIGDWVGHAHGQSLGLPHGHGHRDGHGQDGLCVEVRASEIVVRVSVVPRVDGPMAPVAGDPAMVPQEEVPPVVQPEGLPLDDTDDHDEPQKDDPQDSSAQRPDWRSLGRAGVIANVARLLDACREPCTRAGLQTILGLRNRVHFQRTYLIPLIENGLLARTVPDSRRSSRQRYQTTERGLALLVKGGAA